MAERVQLPRGGRRAAQHVALVADPVDRVADRRFGAGQVGVRLVVRSADQLEPALGQQPADVLPVLWVHVPVGLEVVEFGEHELVVGIPAGHLEVRLDQCQPRLLEREPVADGCRPRLGIRRLRVPPDRVVVEVGDHEQPPAGLGHLELEGEARRPAGALDDDLGVKDPPRRHAILDDDADLQRGLATGLQRTDGHRRLAPNPIALDP